MTEETARAAGPAPPRAGAPLPRTVLALGLTSALNDVASEITIRTIPFFLANVLGVRTGLIGLIEGVAEATATLVKLLAGAASDRSGKRKPLAVTGYTLSNLTKPLLFFATGWPAVLAIRFVDRVGKGLRTAPRDALLADSVAPEDRGRAFGLHRAMDPLGAIVGLLAAAGLIAWKQGGEQLMGVEAFHALVGLAIVPGVLTILVFALGVREPTVAWTPRALTLSGKLPPGLRRYLAAVFVFNLSVLSDAFLSLRAQEVGIPLPGVFLLLALMNLVSAVASYPAGSLSDRIGRKRFVLAGWLVFAVELVGLAWVGGPLALAGLFVLHGLYVGLTDGVEKALLADLAPPDLKGTAFGALHATVAAAALPASLMGGVLWDARGSRTAFLAAAGLAAVGAGLLSLVPSTGIARAVTPA